MFTVLIVEQEVASSDYLVSLLVDTGESVCIVGVLYSIGEALAWLSRNPKPCLIIMDARLRDNPAFLRMGTTQMEIPVVFTAVPDERILYGLREEGADYLLKPVEKESLERLLEKFRDREISFAGNDRRIVLHEVLPRKSRIVVKRGTELRSVRFEEVAYFFTENKIVFLVNRLGEKFLVSKRLRELETALDPSVFFRANRKFIINIDHIRKIKQLGKSQLEVELDTTVPEAIMISSENANLFRQWLEGV